MDRRGIDTLIIDLDNTVYDWFDIWYSSFKPIYDEIVRIAGKPEDEVQQAVRKIHQRRRTSEYTFLLEELDILPDSIKSDVRGAFKSAVELSRVGRDRNLKLYPSVFRTLWLAKAAGTKIVAYTESMRFYSAYRLKRVGLDGVIDTLFSPEDHDIPFGVSVDKYRNLPDEFYELQVTEVRHTPAGGAEAKSEGAARYCLIDRGRSDAMCVRG